MAVLTFARSAWRRQMAILGLCCIGIMAVASLFALPWRDIAVVLARVDLIWLGMALGLNMVILPFWALQWQILAQPFADMPLPRMARIVAVSNGSKAALSGAVGVASGFGALVGLGGMTPAAAGAVMAADQALAITMKLLVTGFALVVAPVGAALWPLLTVWIAVAAGLGLLVAAIVSGRVAQLAKLRPALSLLQSQRLVAVTALAVIKKLAEVLAALAVQMACGLDAGLAGALLVVAAVSLSTLVPVTPANLGTHSAAVAGVYLWLGLPVEAAAGAGILHHALVLASAAAMALLTTPPLLRWPLRRAVVR